MKKSIIKLLLLCSIIVVLVVWNGIYMNYLFPDYIRCQPECSLRNLLVFIPLGIKEEVIFRYLPLVLVTSVYVGLRKLKIKRAKMFIIPFGIFILVIQIVFSSLHIPLDPDYREILYGLPPYPTFEELLNAFLLHGVLGLSLCLCYIIYIPKNNPLSLLQIKSLLASCFVHIVYNQLVITIY